jgi:hypothetical protein
LLADITAGRVDTVVVYKIDRLTRSLADFAKIVEILDTRGATDGQQPVGYRKIFASRVAVSGPTALCHAPIPPPPRRAVRPVRIPVIVIGHSSRR